MSLKSRIQDDVKNAMRAHQRERLAALRLLTAAIKQKEVDERIELNDEQVLAVLDKMVKQRRDSIQQYSNAGREDLAAQEAAEIEVIQEFLPAALSEPEILAIIDAAIAETAAESMRDMGKVMGVVKPQVQGRADVGMVSGLVKKKLG